MKVFHVLAVQALVVERQGKLQLLINGIVEIVLHPIGYPLKGVCDDMTKILMPVRSRNSQTLLLGLSLHAGVTVPSATLLEATR